MKNNTHLPGIRIFAIILCTFLGGAIVAAQMPEVTRLPHPNAYNSSGPQQTEAPSATRLDNPSPSYAVAIPARHAKPDRPATKKERERFIVPHLLILKDDGALRETNGYIKPEVISKRMIETYGDVYDFIAIYTTFFVPGEKGGYHLDIKKETRGLGGDAQILDNSQAFGSQGKLKGIATMSNIEGFFAFDIKSIGHLVHEISHQWLVDLDESKFEKSERLTDFEYPVHWSPFFDSSTKKNGKTYISPMGGYPWIDHGDGTFSIDFKKIPRRKWELFHDIDLYFMGLLPPEKVRPASLIIADDSWDTRIKAEKKIITIDEIIKRAGEPRNPSYTDAQKNFSIGYVLVTEKNHQLSIGELKHMRWIMKNAPREWKRVTRNLSTMDTP